MDLSWKDERIRAAHGIIMAIVFVLVKPLGAVLLRFLKGKVSLRTHIAIQLFAVTAAVAGITLGVYTATVMHRFGKAHVIIGFVVLGTMLIQPALGYWHHKLFLQYNHRTWFGFAHRWVGRIMILLGVINGGIGLGDANNSRPGLIAYIVIAVVFFCTYVVALVLARYRKRKEVD